MHIPLSRLIHGLERELYKKVLFISVRKRLLQKKNIQANFAHVPSSSLNLTYVDSTVLFRSRKFCSSVKPLIMEGVQVEGLPLTMVIDKICEFAPKSLAESWDNVGLLVEPVNPKVVKRILLTNDLTEEVMDEAVEMQTDLIISYHPPIFSPLKSITTRTWKERIIATCLENKIALYSPHTSFDSVKGGVNDWLASAFETTDVIPLVPAVNNSDSYLVEVTLPNDSVGSASLAQLQEIWPLIKKDHTLPETADLKLAVPCTASSLTKLVEILSSTEFACGKSSFKVLKYEKAIIPGHGMGRMCILKHQLTVEKVIEQVKNLIKRPHIKLALAVKKDLGSPVSTIAICAGSGASLLRGVKADLYLTGEMLHHDILDAAHNGTHVILCNHSDSERGFLMPFSQMLSNDMLNGKVQVIVSKRDRDPLITV